VAPPTVASSRRLLTTQQAADHLGASTRTVRRYIAEGRLTGYRLGPRLVRVDHDELEALLRPIPNGAGDAA